MSEKELVTLRPHQKEVLSRLENGKILRGGVGSGKSITALAYYMEKELIGDIYIITTAKKRDSLEWEGEAAKFGLSRDPEATVAGAIHVDSWNNIAKYEDVTGAFFIFDEQRLVGNGAWVKSFYKIIKNKNAWLLLTATPGDTWIDYIPVFIANGFYKNITEFKRKHVVYRPFSRYPQIERFINVEELEAHKREVLVEMPYFSDATRHMREIQVFYDEELFKRALKDRWNVYEDRPCRDQQELFSVLRRITYTDRSRLFMIRKLLEQHPKLIVFYNYNYELDILRELNDTWSDLVTVAEWNGHKKQLIPETDSWVYLVQYTAGAEGWNCIETDAMVFYSLNHSYKKFEQAQGRIDRLNTPFSDLFYFSFLAKNMIDRAVSHSLEQKKDFNAVVWAVENLPKIEPFDMFNE